jgi:hypothetical protein
MAQTLSYKYLEPDDKRIGDDLTSGDRHICLRFTGAGSHSDSTLALKLTSFETTQKRPAWWDKAVSEIVDPGYIRQQITAYNALTADGRTKYVLDRLNGTDHAAALFVLTVLADGEADILSAEHDPVDSVGVCFSITRRYWYYRMGPAPRIRRYAARTHLGVSPIENNWIPLGVDAKYAIADISHLAAAEGKKPNKKFVAAWRDSIVAGSASLTWQPYAAFANTKVDCAATVAPKVGKTGPDHLRLLPATYAVRCSQSLILRGVPPPDMHPSRLAIPTVARLTLPVSTSATISRAGTVALDAIIDSAGLTGGWHLNAVTASPGLQLHDNQIGSLCNIQYLQDGRSILLTVNGLTCQHKADEERPAYIICWLSRLHTMPSNTTSWTSQQASGVADLITYEHVYMDLLRHVSQLSDRQLLAMLASTTVPCCPAALDASIEMHSHHPKDGDDDDDDDDEEVHTASTMDGVKFVDTANKSSSKFLSSANLPLVAAIDRTQIHKLLTYIQPKIIIIRVGRPTYSDKLSYIEIDPMKVKTTYSKWVGRGSGGDDLGTATPSGMLANAIDTMIKESVDPVVAADSTMTAPAPVVSYTYKSAVGDTMTGDAGIVDEVDEALSVEARRGSRRQSGRRGHRRRAAGGVGLYGVSPAEYVPSSILAGNGPYYAGTSNGVYSRSEVDAIVKRASDLQIRVNELEAELRKMRETARYASSYTDSYQAFRTQQDTIATLQSKLRDANVLLAAGGPLGSNAGLGPRLQTAETTNAFQRGQSLVDERNIARLMQRIQNGEAVNSRLQQLVNQLQQQLRSAGDQTELNRELRRLRALEQQLQRDHASHLGINAARDATIKQQSVQIASLNAAIAAASAATTDTAQKENVALKEQLAKANNDALAALNQFNNDINNLHKQMGEEREKHDADLKNGQEECKQRLTRMSTDTTTAMTVAQQKLDKANAELSAVRRQSDDAHVASDQTAVQQKLTIDMATANIQQLTSRIDEQQKVIKQAQVDAQAAKGQLERLSGELLTSHREADGLATQKNTALLKISTLEQQLVQTQKGLDECRQAANADAVIKAQIQQAESDKQAANKQYSTLQQRLHTALTAWSNGQTTATELGAGFVESITHINNRIGMSTRLNQMTTEASSVGITGIAYAPTNEVMKLVKLVRDRIGHDFETAGDAINGLTTAIETPHKAKYQMAATRFVDNYNVMEAIRSMFESMVSGGTAVQNPTTSLQSWAHVDSVSASPESANLVRYYTFVDNLQVLLQAHGGRFVETMSPMSKLAFMARVAGDIIHHSSGQFRSEQEYANAVQSYNAYIRSTARSGPDTTTTTTTTTTTPLAAARSSMQVVTSPLATTTTTAAAQQPVAMDTSGSGHIQAPMFTAPSAMDVVATDEPWPPIIAPIYHTPMTTTTTRLAQPAAMQGVTTTTTMPMATTTTTRPTQKPLTQQPTITMEMLNRSGFGTQQSRAPGGLSAPIKLPTPPKPPTLPPQQRLALAPYVSTPDVKMPLAPQPVAIPSQRMNPFGGAYIDPEALKADTSTYAEMLEEQQKRQETTTLSEFSFLGHLPLPTPSDYEFTSGPADDFSVTLMPYAQYKSTAPTETRNTWGMDVYDLTGVSIFVHWETDVHRPGYIQLPAGTLKSINAIIDGIKDEYKAGYSFADIGGRAGGRMYDIIVADNPDITGATIVLTEFALHAPVALIDDFRKIVRYKYPNYLSSQMEIVFPVVKELRKLRMPTATETEVNSTIGEWAKSVNTLVGSTGSMAVLPFVIAIYDAYSRYTVDLPGSRLPEKDVNGRDIKLPGNSTNFIKQPNDGLTVFNADPIPSTFKYNIEEWAFYYWRLYHRMAEERRKAPVTMSKPVSQQQQDPTEFYKQQ